MLDGIEGSRGSDANYIRGLSNGEAVNQSRDGASA